MSKTIEERAKESAQEIFLDKAVHINHWRDCDNGKLALIADDGIEALKAAYIAGATEAEGWKRVEDGLRNMDKEKLVHVFKKVSLIDLSECSFEYDIDAGKKHWCNAWRNGVVVDAIIFDGNLFYMMNNNATFDRLNPMWAAYKALSNLPSPPVNDNP